MNNATINPKVQAIYIYTLLSMSSWNICYKKKKHKRFIQQQC
jgi:hypothetical protein